MSEGGIFMQVLELGVISLDCVGETPERTRQECRVRFFLVVASSEPPPCGFPPMALISPSLIPLSAAPILLAPNSAYSRSTSAPTKKRPSSLAATPVVADPLKGSKSRSPSTLEASTARRSRRRGFWVGWRPWDFSLMGTAGICQTEETWEVGLGLFMRS